MEPQEGRTLVTRRPHPLTWVLVAIVAASVVVLGVAVVLSDGSDDVVTADEDGQPRELPPDHPNFQFGEDRDLIVFMESTATQHQIDEIADALDGDERVDDVEYVDQAGALAEFQEMFSDDPAMQDDVRDVTAEALPSSFRVAVDGDDAVVEAVGTSFEDEPGVREVSYRASDERVEMFEEADDRDRLAVGELRGGATVIIFFQPTATVSEQRAVYEVLDDSRLVTALDVVDQEEAYEEFSELFSDDPALIESTSPEILPPSIGVVSDLDDAAEVIELACGLADRPEVREVAPGAPYEC